MPENEEQEEKKCTNATRQWFFYSVLNQHSIQIQWAERGQRTIAVHSDLFKFLVLDSVLCGFSSVYFPFVNIIGHYVFTPKKRNVLRLNVPPHLFRFSLRFIYIMLMVYFYGTLWIIFSI